MKALYITLSALCVLLPFPSLEALSTYDEIGQKAVFVFPESIFWLSIFTVIYGLFCLLMAFYDKSQTRGEK